MQRLGLMDVVDAGFRGEQQRFQRDGMDAQRADMQRQQKQRGVYDTAGQQAQAAMQAELAAGEDQQMAMLAGAEAYGGALMKAGDLQGYLKHEATIHPLRLRMRQEAQQEFAVDKDRTKFMKRVYATMPNGEKIVGVEDVRGGPTPNRGTGPTPAPMQAQPTLKQGLAQFDQEVTDPLAAANTAAQAPQQAVVQPGLAGDGRLGAPSGPDKLRVRVSKGGKEDVRDVDFDGFLAGMRELSRDPEREIKLNYERDLAMARAQGQIAVMGARGEQTTKRDATLAGFKKTQAEIDAEKRAALARERDGAAMGRVKEQQTGANFRDLNGPAGGGGGRGGSGNSVQSRSIDQDGYVVLNFKDGTSKRANIDGKPVRSQDWSKRVDSMVKTLADSTAGMSKSVPQLRQEAEQMLMGKPPADPQGAKPNVQSTINRLLGD